MKSQPYQNVSDKVINVVEELLANADNYHETHRARFARTLDVLIGAKPRGRLLEIGTSGLIPHALQRLAPDVEVVVTHFDSTRPTHGRLNLEFSAAAIDVECFSVDLEGEILPAQSESFDFVVCCEVLEHMEVDPMFMLSEVNRVLKTGGTLLLTTPNVLSSRGITKMLNGVEPYFFMQYHKNGSYHRHNYEYSARSLRGVLADAGFSGDVWTEDLFEDGIPSVVNLIRNAGFDIRNTGDNILALMKKISPVLERYPHGLYV